MSIGPEFINLIAASLLSALIIGGAARILYVPVIRNQLENIDKRFDLLNQQIDQRFDGIEKRFDAVDKRMDALERRLDVLDTRLWQFVMSGQRNHQPASEEAES